MKHTDSIVLTGSYARGTQTPSSDLDFMVISNNVTRFHTETIWDGDDEVQVILVPATKIHKMLMERSFEHKGLLISMLKSCKVILDPNGFANKLSKYANDDDNAPNEHSVLAYISTLSNRCNDLKNTNDELEKILLASTIMVLLAHILSYNFISGTKHCMRIVSKSHLRDDLLNVYYNCLQHQDYSPLITFVQKVIGNFKKNILTTGLSLNNLKKEAPVVVFFPKKFLYDNGMTKIIYRMSEKLSDYTFHVFYQGPMQAMNEGTYIFIDNQKQDAIEICKRIRTIDITISRSRVALGIEMIYPYYTTFSEGAYFGGKETLKVLSPVYAALWKEYNKQILHHNSKAFRESYTMATAYLIISRIAGLCHVHTSVVSFFINTLEMLLPDIIDPNGVYNVEQTKYLRSATISVFQEQHLTHKKNIEENIRDILSGQICELEGMLPVTNSLIQVLNSIELNRLSYPDIFPFENAWDIFYIESCLHSLSVLQMTQEQKFAAVYNLAVFNNICLEDSLLLDK